MGETRGLQRTNLQTRRQGLLPPQETTWTRLRTSGPRIAPQTLTMSSSAPGQEMSATSKMASPDWTCTLTGSCQRRFRRETDRPTHHTAACVVVLSPRRSGTPFQLPWQAQDPLTTSSLYFSVRAIAPKHKRKPSKCAGSMGKEWSRHRPQCTQIPTLPDSVSDAGMEAAVGLLHTPPPATPRGVNPLSQVPLSNSDRTPVRSNPPADPSSIPPTLY